MARHEEDAWEEQSWDSEPDAPDDDLSETVSCPECGAEIYEDAVRCPACGSYVTHTTSAWVGRPRWWVVLALVGILATIVALAGLGPW